MNYLLPSRAFFARLTAALLAIGLLCGTDRQASAYTVVLDMDPSTAPVETFPASGILAGPVGPATGFESAITGVPGTFSVVAYLVLDSPADFALLFDHIGVDIGWGAPGDTASLAITGPAPTALPAPGFHPVAGSLASLPSEGFSLDFFDTTMETAGFIDGMGKGLAMDAIPAVAPFTANMGGVGYFDAPGPMFTQFGGFGDGGNPLLTFIDLFTVDFTLVGAPGSTVTLAPSGIFDPASGPGPPMTLTGPAATAVHTSLFGAATPGTFVTGNTVTVVPEPGRALLGLLGLGAVLLRRRR